MVGGVWYPPDGQDGSTGDEGTGGGGGGGGAGGTNIVFNWFGASGGGGGSRTANISPTSVINGHDVTINWDSPAYKFKGTVNAAGTSMSGTFTSNNGGAGTWSARKL